MSAWAARYVPQVVGTSGLGSRSTLITAGFLLRGNSGCLWGCERPSTLTALPMVVSFSGLLGLSVTVSRSGGSTQFTGELVEHVLDLGQTLPQDAGRAVT